ncbi:MAG TPA: mycofactocin biosynthesis peptidyl-dipeptidase MftE [Acidimicrobiales bacterium]
MPRTGPALAALTWPETAAFAEEGSILAVPVASTEQHGPHLPLSTDTDLAIWLCAALATFRSDVLIAPPLPYGSSGEHEGFAGTLSIGQQALEAVLVELCRSALLTFDGVVLVCTHGGNAEPLHRARRTLSDESRRILAWRPRLQGDAHAGRTETSVQLALHPDSVRLGDAEAGDTRDLAEILPTVRATSLKAVSQNGVLGDPAGATADEGRRLLGSLLADLVQTVSSWLGAIR